ncbi:AraC family transcriptional regulator [Sphingosinithalassobacter portus]|uniref:AraC family transcriptional regulator n=1 Tax=Stakelama portus TaxID=2676234 RepID=UPI000D6E2550|nr:AraC family transcriptional regulator [Sphingosinithalassobacter portus]
MDPLSDVLALLEPRSYRVGGFEAGGDWSIRFDAYDTGIKCYAVTAGSCWITVEGAGPPVLLEQGDCFLLPHGWPFRIASDPNLPAEDYRPYFVGSPEGAVVRLHGGGGVTVLGSHFQFAGPHAEMLLGLLPPLVHLKSEADRATLRWAFDRMRQELAIAQPGSVLIAQHLAHMIFVQALRLHLEEGRDAGWFSALSDKRIGAAIAAMHREPARRWTVAMLAADIGMSRSSFAARFRQLVGEGPMAYLTRWRMLRAERSLSRGEAVGTVARSLGYESESAFSTAYKRVMGSTPRRRARSAVIGPLR